MPSRAVGFQQLVHSGVHAGDEEGSDGADVLQVVAVGVSLGDALDVGVDDLLVTLQGEDQGDVHGDALGQGGGDCRQAFEGGRNLDHGVRTVHLGPEFLGLLLGGLGLVSQTRIHFDGDAAVNEIGLLGNLTEDVGGVAHVGGGELAHGGLNVDLAQFLQLRIVRADLVQSLLEDGRVGGHADNVLVGDEILQRAGLDAGAGQVVQPDRDTGVRGALSCFSHCFFSLIPFWIKSCLSVKGEGHMLSCPSPYHHLAASTSAMEALAASTTCSAVMPRSIMF